MCELHSLWNTTAAINTPVSESERIDRSLLDTNGDFRKNYGIDKEAVLLVRPDGHIVSIATQGMCTAITSAMVKMPYGAAIGALRDTTAAGRCVCTAPAITPATCILGDGYPRLAIFSCPIA